MERADLEVQRLACAGVALLAGTELQEVIRSLGHRIRVEHHHQPADRFVPNRNIEEHFWAIGGGSGVYGSSLVVIYGYLREHVAVHCLGLLLSIRDDLLRIGDFDLNMGVLRGGTVRVEYRDKSEKQLQVT